MANRKNSRNVREAAHLFSVLAEPARLRILELLRDNTMCGRELAANLSLTPATTCHHLERLKLARLLSARRAGKHVYYSMSSSEFARTVRKSLDTVLDGKWEKRGTGRTDSGGQGRAEKAKNRKNRLANRASAVPKRARKKK